MSTPTGIDAAKSWKRLTDARAALIAAATELSHTVSMHTHPNVTGPYVRETVEAQAELEAAYAAYRAAKDGVAV